MRVERREAVSEGAERFFRTEQLHAGLRGRTVGGGALTVATQFGKLFVQVATTVVLARLLSPEDYGLFVLSIAVVAFVSLFKEMGLSLAVVQRAEITGGQASALFWMNVAAGCVLALLTAVVVAPVLSWFYGEPRLAWVAVALGGGFILAGLGGVHRALLRRQMRFKALAFVELVSTALGAAAGIVAALYGAGYWSLVWMQLSMAASGAAGTWVACGWRPGLAREGSGVRPLLALGGNFTGFEMINYFSRNTDSLLIGWYLGVQQVGFYDKASQLLLLPVQQFNAPIGSVAVPALSRLQSDAKRFREYYDGCILAAAAAGMPLVAFLFVRAERVIPLALGAQWASAVPIFRALAPAAFLGALYTAFGWTLVSLGRNRRQLVWNLSLSIATVTSYLIGIRWGTVGVAAAFSACRVALLIPALVYCCGDSPLSWKRVAVTTSRPAFAAILSAIVLALTGGGFALVANATGALVLDSLLYVSLYLAVWASFPDGRRALAETWRTLKTLRQRPETGGGASGVAVRVETGG